MENMNTISAEKAKSQELARCGDFNMAYNALKDQGLLEQNVAENKAKYENFFSKNDFTPNQKIWETLTILGLYDEPTQKHCLRTFSLTKDIATKTLLGPDGGNIQIASALSEAGLSLDDLYNASIGHDIGKVKIPLEIINNTITDKEMTEILIKMIRDGEHTEKIASELKIDKDELLQKTDEEIRSYLLENNIRGVGIVPLSKIFADPSHREILERLKENGFNTNDTLRVAVASHEAESERIFHEMDEPKVANLAGHHHNYRSDSEGENRYSISVPGLKNKIAIPHIIQIADTMDSMMSARSYKKGMSRISALAELTRDVERDHLQREIAYLWVSNAYQDLKDTMQRGKAVIKNPSDQRAVEQVERFLTKTKQSFM